MHLLSFYKNKTMQEVVSIFPSKNMYLKAQITQPFSLIFHDANVSTLEFYDDTQEGWLLKQHEAS